MPIGLKRTAPILQRPMHYLRSLVKWKSAQVYLDSIVIYLKSINQHLTHLRQMLTLLLYAVVGFKLRNVLFFAKISNYLSFVIRPGMLMITEMNIKEVMNIENL